MGHTASPGYAYGQLERAVRTALSAKDGGTRRRARAKADRWQDVLTGMATGSLRIGSRVPVAGAPAWVTLEVVHGGFATGRCLAEVPLSPAEAALCPDGPGRTDRERLNLWYLTDAGLAALRCAACSPPSPTGSTSRRTPRCRPSRGCWSTGTPKRRST
ncbi:hypothetical protein [Amycolatopsis sp. A1MSW2902]|uniref:hypothetical protein n=1 Tax=Amycolatopsis sp. A1MSW2902 TaxID=687413 RepID=UPI00307F5EE7